MYHLRLKGKHYDIGCKRGGIFKKFNISFPIRLDEFQADFGKRSIELLEKNYFEVCEEVRGIADTASLNYGNFLSWLLCMGCCMYNLEDNIPKVELRGCTAFAFTHGGKVFYGRDNDLPPYLKKGCTSDLYAIDGANRFIINTSSFVNGEEGINESGLAVAMTFVMTELKDIRAGLNSVFLVRYLLEKCKTVSQAADCLKKLPVASNCNILLADKSGAMAVAECNAHEVFIRDALTMANGEKFVCTVNHFSSDHMAKYDASKQNAFYSMQRYCGAISAFNDISIIEPVIFAKDLLSGKYGFMCQYEKSLNFETVWSSVFEVNDLKIHIAPGNPRRTKYREDARLSGM